MLDPKDAKSTWVPQSRFQGSAAALLPTWSLPPYLGSGHLQELCSHLLLCPPAASGLCSHLSFQRTFLLRPLSCPLLFLPPNQRANILAALFPGPDGRASSAKTFPPIVSWMTPPVHSWHWTAQVQVGEALARALPRQSGLPRDLSSSQERNRLPS